jgi:hypothetical protein
MELKRPYGEKPFIHILHPTWGNEPWMMCKLFANQVVDMTTSHIPVAPSFCHFITLGHYQILISIFSEHLSLHKPHKYFYKDKKIMVFKCVYNDTAWWLKLEILEESRGSFFFMWCWDLNSGPCSYLASSLPFEPWSQSHMEEAKAWLGSRFTTANAGPTQGIDKGVYRFHQQL